ncbi:hypothetical protein SNE40_023434 [Patella caerulea]|uniref:EGF-like domain-containing protein n=1 Tax=Patella caerulea TaxID=87958 RepID=A0AAN8IYP5_PATCE
MFYNGMCHCPAGFSGPHCNVVVPSCCKEVSRQHHYSARTGGDIKLGSIQSIIDAIKNQKMHKIRVMGAGHDTIYSIVAVGIENYRNVWAQTYDHISVDFNDRRNQTIMHFTKQISNERISSLGGELNSSTEIRTTSNAEIEWSSSSADEPVPVLTVNSSGVVTNGSVSGCRDALENGSDLRIVYGVYSVNTQYVNFENSIINVKIVPSVGQYHLRLLIPSYWFIQFVRSNAKKSVIRWNRISHTYKYGLKNTMMGSTWYIDSGWNVAYSHDPFGRRINGSKSYLEGAVRNGNPIKARVGDTISMLHDVRLSNGEVSGVTVDILNLTLWHVNQVQMIRSRVSSTGTVSSCTFTMESDLNMYGFSGQEGIIWYVESRIWTKIMTLDPFDGITWGAVDDLYLAATSWKSLKVVIKHLDLSYQSVDVTNVHLINSTFIILHTANKGAVQLVANELQCQQWAGFLYSDGMFETVKWTPGRRIIEERTVIQYLSADIFSEI